MPLCFAAMGQHVTEKVRRGSISGRCPCAGHASKNGCEREESAVSGTICAAPALPTRKRRESGFRQRMIERGLLPPSCLFRTLREFNITSRHVSKGRGDQISTVSTYHAYKREHLDRIEQPLYTSHTCITGRDHR